MKKVILVFFLLAFSASSFSQGGPFVLNELVTKTVPGIGSTETFTFPTGLMDAGDYNCFVYIISELGVTSAESMPGPVSKTGAGPHPVSITFDWPTLYTDGTSILSGEVRTARITCESVFAPPPPTNPTPEVATNLTVN